MAIRYRILLPGILIILTTSLSWTQPGACDSSFRVLTFNLRYNNPGDSINAWPNRKARVAALIRYHSADVCGFQEALEGQIGDLTGLLPEFGWYGVGRDDGEKRGEFNPIFFRKDRFGLLRDGTFWLSPTPDTAGSKGWDAALPRIVTWAELQDRITGKKFIFFNTHFDHQGETARRMSARMLLDSAEMKIRSYPVIVTGDFNTTDTSAAYRAMTSRDLQDAITVSKIPHYGPRSSWDGFREIEPGNRIDFIFVSNRVSVYTHAILTDRWDGRFASDHLPVITRVTIQ